MVWALGIVKQEEAFFFSLWDMKRKKTLQTITTYFKMYWETWGGKEMRQDFCKEGCSQTICTAQCEMHTGLLMSAGCKSVPHPLPPATPNWVCIQIVQVVFASESSFPKKRGELQQSVLTKEGRVFCSASSGTAKPRTGSHVSALLRSRRALAAVHWTGWF